MTKFETYDYILPSYIMSGLINGDISGLEDEEAAKLERFEDMIVEKHGVGHWDIGQDESEFMHSNDFDSYAGDCIYCSYHVNISSEGLLK